MVRNLKYIKKSIEDYFSRHAMVNTVKFGDTDNLSIYRDIQYPLMNFDYVDSTFKAGNNNTARFTFAIMDLSNDEIEFDVVDAMNEVANDYLKHLENSIDIEILPNVSIVPFQDEFADRCSGVTFTVSFTVFRNNCQDILPFS